VAAIVVAHSPVAVNVVDLRMLSAAEFVFQDDAIGAATAQGVPLPPHEREHVPKAVLLTDHQIGCGDSRHFHRASQKWMPKLRIFYDSHALPVQARKIG